MTATNPQQLQAQFNAMLGGRRNKRRILRSYYKKQGVPRPLFAKVSDMLTFKHLNYLTFMEDMMKAVQASNKEQGT
jgi:hypothetical protein